MFLLKAFTSMTLEEIAALLNKKDHTTIMHGIEKITLLITTNEKIKTDVNNLENKLGVVRG